MAAVLALAWAGVAAGLEVVFKDPPVDADSVRVARLRVPVPGEALPTGDDRLSDFVVEREGRADESWKRSMARLLSTAMKGNTEPGICARTFGPRHTRFAVQFIRGGERTTFVLYLADRCIESWSGRSFQRSAEMRGSTDDFLALIKRAFPGDTSIRNLSRSGLISCEDYVREHGGTAPLQQPPEVIRLVPPRYPSAAKKAGIQGRVRVHVKVEADGSVSEMKVVDSVPELDAAALASVREWKFEAALDCWGEPTGAVLVVPVNFKL